MSGYEMTQDEMRDLESKALNDDHALFHGHHPACPYTIEGDWSVCDCGASRSLDPERLARAIRVEGASGRQDGMSFVRLAKFESLTLAALLAAEYARD